MRQAVEGYSIVHNNVQPSHVCLSKDGLTAKLIGFSGATLRPIQRPSDASTSTSPASDDVAPSASFTRDVTSSPVCILPSTSSSGALVTPTGLVFTLEHNCLRKTEVLSVRSLEVD